MPQSMNYRDLLVRCLVITLVSLVLTFLTQNNNFDLHFKIRKTQNTDERLQLITIGKEQNIDSIIKQILNKSAQHIFVNDFLSESSTKKITPYTTVDHNPEHLALEINPDSDGLVRRVQFLWQPTSLLKSTPIKKLLNINFRGPQNTFDSIPASDLKNIIDQLDDKIVIISNLDSPTTYATPVGLLTETELVANIIDNALKTRFIANGQLNLQLFILFFSLILVVGLIIYLPSTLALVSTILFALTYISLSLWFFDNFNIWTPLITPLIQTILTFLLISNYKYVLNEKTKWNLEKESLFLNEMEEMKTNFLSLFSHDLKTPLAKIIGITDTLMSKTKDPDFKNELEKISQSTNDLERYIQRILKMSLVQSKNTTLNKEPEDINNLIERSVKHNKDLATAKSIEIKTQLNPLFMVEIDGPLIQEVINNLVENAIKYSPIKSTVTIKSKENKKELKVSVTDQGPGIPKKAQEDIWEKYYRFDKTQSGYGLGLFLCRYVIHLHGGQVFLNSKENQGSEFSFTIPLNTQTTTTKGPVNDEDKYETLKNSYC